jgi:hypothetical protein
MIVGPARQAGGIDSLESIPGLLQIRALNTMHTIQQAVKRQTCKIFCCKIFLSSLTLSPSPLPVTHTLSFLHIYNELHEHLGSLISVYYSVLTV